MEFDDDFEFSYIKKKPPYSPDLHLKTAIRRYEREMFLQGFCKRNIPIHFPVKKSVVAYEKFQHKPTGILKIESEFSYKTLLNPCLSVNGKGEIHKKS